MLELYLVRGQDGKIALCQATPIGMIIIKEFKDTEELERFGMGIVGYCQCANPPASTIPIPDVFTKAFQ